MLTFCDLEVVSWNQIGIQRFKYKLRDATGRIFNIYADCLICIRTGVAVSVQAKAIDNSRLEFVAFA